ncbi:glycosyltransferase family 28 C-terminal domain-containing protein [Stachybotrys elegans]|uniref:UDP-N-acetylglucosamine transferase subunit ALG13 n=1 Tax=Stachybotrys elegans TaxID=80388 RepID=A0A8K0WVC3_9HYPO|nr:glycosyltransferase family 28 C-terminal domain-containing protein [Stachybotrys elegans]
MNSSSSLERCCLITVGATVGFQSLIETALNPDFWRFLSARGFTKLRIQCGPDAQWAEDMLATTKEKVPSGIEIKIFATRKNLMKEEMTLCKPVEGRRSQGLVISHAGTGTILDAWKLGLPIVVVPNSSLLDDHQTEMARHLAKEGYATMSSTDCKDLQEAIHKSELLADENKFRWPTHSVQANSTAKTRLWEMAPVEIEKEQDTQMIFD